MNITKMSDKTWSYSVRGKGHFPMDMLRYDCVWPRDSLALDGMTDRPDFYERRLDFFEKERTIKLGSIKEPTVGRWLSFGWIIL